MPNEKLKIETVSDLIKKPTATAHIGSLNVNLYNITFTKRQIKNYKKYFNIDIENVEDKKDAH